MIAIPVRETRTGAVAHTTRDKKATQSFLLVQIVKKKAEESFRGRCLFFVFTESWS